MNSCWFCHMHLDPYSDTDYNYIYIRGYGQLDICATCSDNVIKHCNDCGTNGIARTTSICPKCKELACSECMKYICKYFVCLKCRQKDNAFAKNTVRCKECSRSHHQYK